MIIILTAAAAAVTTTITDKVEKSMTWTPVLHLLEVMTTPMLSCKGSNNNSSSSSNITAVANSVVCHYPSALGEKLICFENNSSMALWEIRYARLNADNFLSLPPQLFDLHLLSTFLHTNQSKSTPPPTTVQQAQQQQQYTAHPHQNSLSSLSGMSGSGHQNDLYRRLSPLSFIASMPNNIGYNTISPGSANRFLVQQQQQQHGGTSAPMNKHGMGSSSSSSSTSHYQAMSTSSSSSHSFIKSEPHHDGSHAVSTASSHPSMRFSPEDEFWHSPSSPRDIPPSSSSTIGAVHTTAAASGGSHPQPPNHHNHYPLRPPSALMFGQNQALSDEVLHTHDFLC